MLVGLCGGICAGKHEVANYLVKFHGFKVLRLSSPALTPLPTSSDIDPTANTNTVVTSLLSKDDGTDSFSTVDTLLEYVTARWRERFVTTQVWDEDILETLLRRPFFILVSVDAPIVVRWKRYTKRCEELNIPSPSLEAFVAKSDAHMYSPPHGLYPLISRSTIRLVNPSSDLTTLHIHLTALDLVDESRLRPTWDAYFMQLAGLAAQRSNCMKRRVGCVLVREKRVVSTGYNGTPKGLTNCNGGGCARCNSGALGGAALSTCLCLHAEENALLEAGRDRIREGSTLYCDTCPCLTCSIKIVQVGISEVVYSQGYSMDTETAAVLHEGGVKLRQFSPPRQGVVYLGDNSETS